MLARNFISVVLIIVGFNVFGQEISWVDPSEIDQKMSEEPRKIFVDLTAKWCGWCKVMDKKTFSQEEVYSYMNENYYAMKLDIDQNVSFDLLGNTYSAKVLAQKHGIQGLPGFLFINESLETVVPSQGFQKPKELLRKLKVFNQ